MIALPCVFCEVSSMIPVLRDSFENGAFGKGFKPGMCDNKPVSSAAVSVAMGHRWSDHPAKDAVAEKASVFAIASFGDVH